MGHQLRLLLEHICNSKDQLMPAIITGGVPEIFSWQLTGMLS